MDNRLCTNFDTPCSCPMFSHLANSHFRKNLKEEFNIPSITKDSMFKCPRYACFLDAKLHEQLTLLLGCPLYARKEPIAPRSTCVSIVLNVLMSIIFIFIDEGHLYNRSLLSFTHSQLGDLLNCSHTHTLQVCRT